MEIKPYSFSVFSLLSHLIYVYMYFFYFTLQFSLELQIYFEKLFKSFIYRVTFCDGERYALTYLQIKFGKDLMNAKDL